MRNKELSRVGGWGSLWGWTFFQGGMRGIPDADDRHVLAAAIRGDANAIVTFNTRDFPADCLGQYDIVCQTPDEFLVDQFQLDPQLVFDKLDEQASNIGKDRRYIIERLRTMGPKFADLVELSAPLKQEERGPM